MAKHYAFTESPFGNFAVSHNGDDTFTLSPIGELTEVPVSDSGYIDTDALRTEAHRQLTARGSAPTPYVHPSPEFTVNRVHYATELSIHERAYSHLPEPVTIVKALGVFTELTDSAETKIAKWWNTVKADVLTEEFYARDAYNRAQLDMEFVNRARVKAQEALDEADAEARRAAQALADAEARVAAL